MHTYTILVYRFPFIMLPAIYYATCYMYLLELPSLFVHWSIYHYCIHFTDPNTMHLSFDTIFDFFCYMNFYLGIAITCISNFVGGL